MVLTNFPKQVKNTVINLLIEGKVLPETVLTFQSEVLNHLIGGLEHMGIT